MSYSIIVCNIVIKYYEIMYDYTYESIIYVYAQQTCMKIMYRDNSYNYVTYNSLYVLLTIMIILYIPIITHLLIVLLIILKFSLIIRFVLLNSINLYFLSFLDFFIIDFSSTFIKILLYY